MYGYEIFHEELLTALIGTIRAGGGAHAYLFSGEPGLGRHTAARLFAAALTCAHPQTAPCGACPSCVQAKAQTNPDIVYLDSADKKSIGVDPIRALSDEVYIKPFGSARKVYIIEADQMTEAAQNAFLKTLEEPPPYAVFLLITAGPDQLLQTILSRCTLIRFAPLAAGKMRGFLRERFPQEQSREDFLVKFSEGNPGTLARIIEDEAFEPLRRSALDQLKYLFSQKKTSIYKTADYFDANKDRLPQILNFWIVYLRDILLLSQGLRDQIINADLEQELLKFVSRFDPKAIAAAMEEIVLAHEMEKRYVNTRACALGLALRVKDKILQ